MDERTERLRTLIIQKYKSVRQFAAAADIPYTTLISALEKGIGGTSVETVLKICDMLEIDIYELSDKKTPVVGQNDERAKIIDYIISSMEALSDEELEKFRKIFSAVFDKDK